MSAKEMRERAAKVADYHAGVARLAMQGDCTGDSGLRMKLMIATSIASEIRALDADDAHAATEPSDQANDGDRRVTVCSACLRASCWHGELMCDYAEGAGTVEKTVAELRAGQHGESEHYWTRQS